MVDMADRRIWFHVRVVKSGLLVVLVHEKSALGLEIVVASVNHQHSRYVSRRLALRKAVRRLRPKPRAGEDNAVLRRSH